MRRLLFLVLSTTLLLPDTGFAQERFTAVFLNAGPAFSSGDAFEVHNTGLAVGGGFEMPWTSSFSVRGELNYDRFPLDQAELLGRLGVPTGTQVDLDGGGVSALTALAALKYRLPVSGRSIRPYLLAGLGFWRLTQDDLTVRTPTDAGTVNGHSDNGVAGALAAGVNVPLDEATALFVEGRYVVGWDFGDPPDLDESFLPLKLGVSFTP